MRDVESWGGALQLNGGPACKLRLHAITDGTVDAVFDEGLALCLEPPLAAGFKPLTLEPETFAKLGEMGWRGVVMPAGRYKGLEADHACIDYSGWPLYARTDLPDDDAYKIVDAIHARERDVELDRLKALTPDHVIRALRHETGAPLRDDPLVPALAHWDREHCFLDSTQAHSSQ